MEVIDKVVLKRFNSKVRCWSWMEVCGVLLFADLDISPIFDVYCAAPCQ